LPELAAAGTANAVDALVWYFAYGSNLCPDTFLGRRAMRPLAARPGRLDGFRLVFDLPVGPGERGVANVVEDPAASVCGVAYLLTASDAERLDRSEGVHAGVYRRLPVVVRTPEEGAIAAFTYRSAFGRPGRKPSSHYLRLLLDGARHHRLPATWIAFLESHPLAVDERLREPA
jgi:hypothetical protein